MIVSRSYTIYQLIFTRLIAGFSVGLQQVAVATFVSESTNPKLRPIFGVITTLTANAGTVSNRKGLAFSIRILFIGFLIINMIPESVADWRGTAFIGALLSAPLVILISFCPESPYYLVKKGILEKKNSLEIEMI